MIGAIRGRRAVLAGGALVALLAGGCAAGGTGRTPGSVAGSRPPTPSTTRTTTSAESTPTTTTTPGPPYPVARSQVSLVDLSRPTISHGTEISPSRSLTTLLWVPQAVGPRPLVVFAHGYQVGPEPYSALLAAWAAHGYVVAAPEFPLTDQAVAGAGLDENDIVNQPADLRFVIDSLAGPGSPVAGRIDRREVAVAGHSDGGESALEASVDAAPAGQPAIRAVIAMSVQPLLPVGPTANPPILVTQGDADPINAPALGRQTYQVARSPKYLLILRGGGHLPPLEAGSPWLAGVVATSEAFLDTYVAGRRPATGIAAAPTAQPALFSLSSG